jgi:hypothetical protein|tara:strand:+ start:382 stop:609 length:228 start_codon:yes stop_codon:yes gene_type:complete
MTIDIKKFAALQKASKDSFFQQKKLVKQVIEGRLVKCKKCQQPLSLIAPKVGKADSQVEGIRCQKGCTDIQLDFA